MYQSGSRFEGRRGGPPSPYRRGGGGGGRRRSRSRSPPSYSRRDRRDNDDMYRFNGNRDDRRHEFTFSQPIPDRRGQAQRRRSPEIFRGRDLDRDYDDRDYGRERDRYDDRGHGQGNYRSGGDRYGRSDRFRDGRGRSPPRGPRNWNPGRERIKDNYARTKRMPIPAHERPILHVQREATPEQLEGMQTQTAFEEPVENPEDDNGSEGEGPMDIEGVENEEVEVEKDGDALELEKAEKVKKDVIAMIRKAKKAAPKPERNAVADNDDFIPLDFGDEIKLAPAPGEVDSSSSDDDDEGDDEQDSPRKMRRTDDGQRGGSGDETPKFAVPDGGSFSHRINLHQNLESKLPPKPSSQVGMEGFTAKSGIPPNGQSNGAKASGTKRKNVFDEDEESEEEVLLEPPSSAKKRKLAERGQKSIKFLRGLLIADYRVTSRTPTECPWLREDHSATLHMDAWLHKEIIDFVEFLAPTVQEKAARQHCIYRLQRALCSDYQDSFTDADIRCFGSFASNLFLPTSDLDVVLLSKDFMRTGIPKYIENSHMNKVTKLLRRSVADFEGIQPIKGAKVPIIKYTDLYTKLKVDISFENVSGIRAISTLKEWRSLYPALPFLVTLVKQFLQMRGFSEVYNGGLGGFSVICMVVFFLRTHPSFTSESVDPRLNLGYAFMEFLDLYGNKINTYDVGIDPAEGKYFTKPRDPSITSQKHYKPYLLSIIDPNDRNNDLTKSSFNIIEIFRCFSEALESLRTEMERLKNLPLEKRKNASLLKCIFGGDYSRTTAHRDLLTAYCHENVSKSFWPTGEDSEELNEINGTSHSNGLGYNGVPPPPGMTAPPPLPLGPPPAPSFVFDRSLPPRPLTSASRPNSGPRQGGRKPTPKTRTWNGHGQGSGPNGGRDDYNKRRRNDGDNRRWR